MVTVSGPGRKSLVLAEKRRCDLFGCTAFGCLASVSSKPSRLVGDVVVEHLGVSVVEILAGILSYHPTHLLMAPANTWAQPQPEIRDELRTTASTDALPFRELFTGTEDD